MPEEHMQINKDGRLERSMVYDPVEFLQSFGDLLDRDDVRHELALMRKHFPEQFVVAKAVLFAALLHDQEHLNYLLDWEADEKSLRARKQ